MLRKLLRRLRQTPKHVYRRLVGGGVILMYHRISEPNNDPFHLSVSPQHFREHLELMRRDRVPMPLCEMVRAARENRLPRNAVAVTLDDGYVDSLVSASPLLAEYDVPATVFIATGQVGKTRGFWWDELERIVLHTRTLPKLLRLPAGEHSRQWNLPNNIDDIASRSSAGGDSRRRTPRLALFWDLYDFLIELPESRRLVAQDQLLTWAGLTADIPTANRALSLDQLMHLGKVDAINIGAHSVSHPLLSHLPAKKQYDEMHGSKAWLEDVIGRPVSSFAYPYGDFNDASLIAARDARFKHACTCIPDHLDTATDVYRLPRIEIQDGDGDHFSKSFY